MKLDDKGRCCGRKPLVYKRDKHLFCCRCDRSFDMDGNQITNWAWRDSGKGFEPTSPRRADTPSAD